LNAAYVGAEEKCTGNEFQIKGALIKKNMVTSNALNIFT